MTIGIFYDTLLAKGGAEKVVVQLANRLGADIITSGFTRDRLIVQPMYEVHDLGNVSAKFFRSFGYLCEAPLRFYWFRNKFHYDVKIYIGFTSIFAATRAGYERNVWYCLTPNRILYDLGRRRLESEWFLGKLASLVYVAVFLHWDRKAIRRMRLIVSQTRTVRDRVQRCYGRHSKVIYAPVDIRAYEPTRGGHYFLAVSRLVPDKRMSLIAEAFAGRTEELVMVGDGPERERIQAIIARCPNISLLQDISDQRLSQLYANCRATIYMPVDEDYGLVPLEGMACGKPCIASNEGGCRETVVDNRTGFLIEPTIEAIRQAVGRMTSSVADHFFEDSVRQAQRFDIDTCVSSWHAVLRAFDLPLSSPETEPS
jgi:glycosyltransferase involved in cell wall biosynthesis